jgi:glycosyltransferase involved in cell wall biosynthesis
VTIPAGVGEPNGALNDRAPNDYDRADLRVAIAHEWLVSYAGSERCVAELLREFPGAVVYTSVLRPSEVPPELRHARTSLLQHIPGAPTHHEWLLPVLPLSWALRRPIDDVDVVISSSHSCAKAVRVAAGIPHVCYCHTPMRYAWFFEEERGRFPVPLQGAASVAMAGFRRWDVRTSRRVTQFVANSTAVADRILQFYGRDSTVVHPPVRTDFFTPGGSGRSGFLFAGRLVSYKRADLVVEAFRTLPYELTVVGSGQQLESLVRQATPNVRFVSSVSDDELRDLYRSSVAMVFPGVEDFGIVMAEAQACGTPVIATAAGGALDIVEPGRTGWLLEDPSVESIRAAVAEAGAEPFAADTIAAAAGRFSSARFRTEMRDVVEAVITHG